MVCMMFIYHMGCTFLAYLRILYCPRFSTISISLFYWRIPFNIYHNLRSCSWKICVFRTQIFCSKTCLRSGLPDIWILAYHDDCIILESTDEEHFQDLRRIFERLNVLKMNINSHSHVRLSDTWAHNNNCWNFVYTYKILAILDMLSPKNAKQALSFTHTNLFMVSGFY